MAYIISKEESLMAAGGKWFIINKKDMTGNPLWDFIAFDQLFNNNGSSSGGGGDDDNSKWVTIIAVILFIIIFVCIYAC